MINFLRTAMTDMGLSLNYVTLYRGRGILACVLQDGFPILKTFSYSAFYVLRSEGCLRPNIVLRNLGPKL